MAEVGIAFRLNAITDCMIFSDICTDCDLFTLTKSIQLQLICRGLHVTWYSDVTEFNCIYGSVSGCLVLGHVVCIVIFLLDADRQRYIDIFKSLGINKCPCEIPGTERADDSVDIWHRQHDCRKLSANKISQRPHTSAKAVPDPEFVSGSRVRIRTSDPDDFQNLMGTSLFGCSKLRLR